MAPRPMTLGPVFDRIYRGNLWNGDESLSGPGSGSAATERVRAELLELVDRLGVTSVLDVGCGDGYWMPDLPGYVGIDVSNEAIHRARTRHRGRRYIVGDVASIAPGPFDLVICRDAMQHLPLADGVQLLRDIAATGSKYLLASTYRDGQNVSIPVGDAYRPNLCEWPFGLSWPDAFIFDGYYYHQHDTDEVRDSGKNLALWPIDEVAEAVR